MSAFCSCSTLDAAAASTAAQQCGDVTCGMLVLSLLSFVSKAAVVCLLPVRYLYAAHSPLEGLDLDGAGFNSVLQSAVNSIVWPATGPGYGLLAASLISAALSSPLVQQLLLGWCTPVPQDSLWNQRWVPHHFAEWNILDASPEPCHVPEMEPMDSSLLVSQTAVDVRLLLNHAYQLFKLLSPILPIVVGYLQFRRHELHGRVNVSDLHLPKGIYRSFAVILIAESMCYLAAMTSESWEQVWDQHPAALLSKFHWDLPWAAAMLARMLGMLGNNALLFPLPLGLVALALTVMLFAAKESVCRRVRRPGTVLLHVALSIASLLALHRLAFVALARLTAIRAHQFAYALKKVAHSVVTQYRFATAQPSQGPENRSQLPNGSGLGTKAHPSGLGLRASQSVHANLGINTRVGQVQHSVSAVATPLHNRLLSRVLGDRRGSEPVLNAPKSEDKADEMDSFLDSDDDSKAPLDVTAVGTRAERAHTKDIAAAVVALSKGVIPCTPLERLEQYKMATAGERRLRKVSTLVWSVLLAHATILAVADVYPRSDASTNGAFDTNYQRGATSMEFRALAVFFSHSIHFLHIVYMWTFVQRKVQRAEQGIIDAWEEVKLLHSRLPASSIKREEADDWLQFLRSKMNSTSPAWPARIISALGIMRFVLPALLMMDPSSSFKENVLGALRGFAMGGKEKTKF